MISSFLLRKKYPQQHHTFPNPEFTPFGKFLGEPILQPTCHEGCQRCILICPTQAITKDPTHGLTIDLGRCVFCGECAKVCEHHAIRFSKRFNLVAGTREDLLVNTVQHLPHAVIQPPEKRIGTKKILNILKINGGGCGSCELELTSLISPQLCLNEHLLRITDQPTHADIMIVVGSVSPKMINPIRETYRHIPDPKILVAVGSCAISGGPFRTEKSHHGLPPDLIPDLYIPGCAPLPYAVLYTLLAYLERISPMEDGAFTQAQHTLGE